MPKSARPWIVTRHDPIEKHEDNLWTVAGDVPGVPIRRRMSIVRLSSGELMFFNAIPLEDELLDEIRAWGKPAMLVVPHHQHMIDASAFQAKLGLKLYGPSQCEAQVRKRAELTGTLEAIAADKDVTVEPMSGSKLGEPVIIVRSGGGSRASILFADVIQNSSKQSLILPFRLMGFGGGPKVVPMYKLMFVKDKASVREQLASLSAVPGLTRLVPCHGDIVTDGARVALKKAADSL